jgi:hypothetical protein
MFLGKHQNGPECVTNVNGFEKDVLHMTRYEFCEEEQFLTAKNFTYAVRYKIGSSGSVPLLYE